MGPRRTCAVRWPSRCLATANACSACGFRYDALECQNTARLDFHVVLAFFCFESDKSDEQRWVHRRLNCLKIAKIGCRKNKTKTVCTACILRQMRAPSHRAQVLSKHQDCLSPAKVDFFSLLHQNASELITTNRLANQYSKIYYNYPSGVRFAIRDRLSHHLCRRCN